MDHSCDGASHLTCAICPQLHKTGRQTLKCHYVWPLYTYQIALSTVSPRHLY